MKIPQCSVIFLVVILIIQSATSKRAKSQSASKKRQQPSKKIPVSQSKPRRPHIILLVADDLGWNDIGFHNPMIKSPNINRLANGGIILNNHYSQSSCSPSRASLLTGRYPSTIGAGLNHQNFHQLEDIGLPMKEVLLPAKLKELGYATHMIGKWHLGFSRNKYIPTSRGFDHFYGFYGGHTDFWTREVSGDSACKLHLQRPVIDLHHDGKVVRDKNGTYTTHLFADETVKAIHSHNKSKPLFLYVAFANTHSPNQAAPGFEKKYSNILDIERRLFATKVTVLDNAVGKITRALKRSGLYKDSIIVFVSDNGGSVRYGNNWPFRGHKGTVYEGGVKTVAFIHGHKLPRSGVRSNALLHISDWFPTLFKLAKGDIPNLPNALDGYNVWKAITEGKPSPRKEVLLALGPNKKGIRVGNWKLIQGEEDALWYYPPEINSKPPAGWSYLTRYLRKVRLADRIPVGLYNIVGDPEERHDLSCRYPNMVSYLLKRLRAYISNMSIMKQSRSCNARAVKTAAKYNAWVPWVGDDETNVEVENVVTAFKNYYEELRAKYKEMTKLRPKLLLKGCKKRVSKLKNDEEISTESHFTTCPPTQFCSYQQFCMKILDLFI